MTTKWLEYRSNEGNKGSDLSIVIETVIFINFVNLAIENVSCTLFITIQDRSLAEVAGFIRNEFQKSGSNWIAGKKFG